MLEDEKLSPLAVLVQSPKEKKNCNYLVLINLQYSPSTTSFTDITLEELSEEKNMLYLYREASPNGPDFSPTSKITEVERTYKNKILGWFRRFAQNDPFLNSIYALLRNEEALLVQEIEKKIAELPKQPLCLSIKINDKYVGEFEIFQQRFLEAYLEEWMGKPVRDKTCSICQERKDVYGNIRVFKFYTLDKPGFIAGGFREENAWRNYPVCRECILALERGRTFLEKHSRYSFHKLNYLLIPNFLKGGKELIGEFVEISQFTPAEISLRRTKLRRITDAEDEILELLSEYEDNISLNFLFIRKEQGAERILLLIEDVLPSRLREIFKAKQYVEEKMNTIEFTFATIRRFFSKSDEEDRRTDLDKYFLTVVDAVFKNHPLSFPFLCKFFINHIRASFVREEEMQFKQRVRDAFRCLIFLHYLKLINLGEEENSMESKLQPIYEKYAWALNTPLKKALFALGALTQNLLDVQNRQRGSTPFWKNLKSLRMDVRDFKELLPKVISKLEEYDRLGPFKRLAEEVASQMLLAGDKWNLSNEEMNFYFACGMAMAGEVNDILFPPKEEEKN